MWQPRAAWCPNTAFCSCSPPKLHRYEPLPPRAPHFSNSPPFRIFESFTARGNRSSILSFEDRDLLPKDEVLQHQTAMAAKEANHDSE